MAQTSNFGVTTAISIDGIGDILSTPASTSALYPNNNVTLEGIQLAGSSSFIRDSTSSFMQDLESRRRARNNAIVAKIQELEANASIQAARSERFKMMREEYETLVRKYASNRKWNWSPGSFPNGFVNGSNGYNQAVHRYNGASLSHHNQPLTTSYNGFGSQQPNYSTEGTNENQQPSNLQLSRGEINKTFINVGVNTDLTGAVRSVLGGESSADNDSRIEPTTEGKKVKVIIDTESQTELVEMASHSQYIESKMRNSKWPTVPVPCSSSSGNFIYDGGEKLNQNTIGNEIKEVSSNITTSKNLSSSKKMEMVMSMMLEDEEDDEESLLEKHERKRKLQLAEFHQQPKASSRALDDSTSIITSEEGTESRNLLNTSNTTDEGLLKLGQRQKKEQSMKEKSGIGRLEDMLKKKYREDSVADSSLSFANDRKVTGAEDGGVGGFTDLSFSDTASVFQRHDVERRKLLEQIGSSSKNEVKWKRKSKLGAVSGGESSSDEEKNKSPAIKSRIARKYAMDVEDDEPTTGGGAAGGGATSESIGDSFMDSIHKTPDTLPKDNSELQEIRKGALEEHREQAEIKFIRKVSPDAGFPTYSDDEVDDDVLVVTAPAAPNKPSSMNIDEESRDFIPIQSGVNDKLSKETTEIGLKRLNSEEEREDYQKEQINDAEEIRSNNLSSSKFDVPAEQVIEGITDANSVGKLASIPQNQEENEKRKDFQLESYEDEGKEPKREKLLPSKNKITKGDVVPNKKGMISHSPAPSANVSAHSSSSSSFTSSAGNLPVGGKMEETEHQQHLEKNTVSIPPCKQVQRESSTGSSSSTSTRQHSLEEQEGEPNQSLQANEKDDKLHSQTETEQDATAAEMQEDVTSTSPQSSHQRHHQLQTKVKKEPDTSAPLGKSSEKMPERVSSPSVKSASITDGTNLSGVEKTAKATKGSAPFHQSSSSKKTGDLGKESGMTGGVNNIRSGKSKSPGKQPAPTTVHTGPPGARYTATRVRLKLNYDSESDSGTENLPKKAINVSGGGGDGKTSNTNTTAQHQKSNNERKENSQKPKEDDDFDDFFDI